MGKTVTSTKRRKRRRLRTGVLLVVGVILGWYGVGRLISPWTVTKLITLDGQHQVARTDTFDTLRVGIHNIAHGRGGRLGARNWDGGDHAAKLARLEQIADLLRSADLDLLVLNEVAPWRCHGLFYGSLSGCRCGGCGMCGASGRVRLP